MLSLMYEKEKSLFRRLIDNMDWMLFAATIALILVGMLFVFSATLRFGDPGRYFARQLFALVFGLGVMVFFTGFNYQYFKQMSTSLYVISTLALILVLFYGTSVRGTKGWFDLGYFSFQPVEITKILFIFVLSGYLDRRKREIKKFTSLFVPLCLLMGQVMLILIQPDFSSTLVYFPVTLTLLYIIGVEPLYLIALVIYSALAMGIPLLATFFKLQPALLKAHVVLNYLVVASRGGVQALVVIAVIIAILFILWWFLREMRINIPFVYYIAICGIITAGCASSLVVQKALKDYQRKRLVVFMNPDLDPLGSGYNIIQSKIALGSGKMFGRGLFSGTQAQLGFLPEQHTDFIFSVLGEETGYLFSQFTIIIYFMLVWRAMIVARDARDCFGSLVASGIAGMFAFYGVINIGMVMGLMPATGLPLPLISYGGSSLVSSLLAIGILFSIHIRRFTY